MNNEQINNEAVELQRIQSLKVSEMDSSLIDNLEFDGIDHRDYPDYCDAYISAADYNGYPMSDDQLDELNDDYDYVYNALMNYLY